jgi:hypothetical protein
MDLNENKKQQENETVYLIIKFEISGTLRFLSHSQMLSLFQRAIVRAGITPQYSMGFNPRPKVQLPLPRPVGVESDNELLVIGVMSQASPEGMPKVLPSRNEDEMIAKRGRDALDTMSQEYFNCLSAQIPDGCKLQSVDMVREKPHFQPYEFSYIFTIRPQYFDKNLQNRINSVITSESLFVERSIDTKNLIKKIDIRGFLVSIMTEQNCIIVQCKFSEAGSIRIQEIMDLLELDMEMLACPIKRTNVQWHK